MTDNQINVAIAQECGWSKADAKRGYTLSQFTEQVPDYCNDLNAMHEAEKSIPDELWNCYFNQLARITKAEQSDDRVFFCATARERAEAFLRTLGKWEEPVVKESFTTDGDHLGDANKMVWEATTEQSSADHFRDATKKVGEVQP